MYVFDTYTISHKSKNQIKRPLKQINLRMITVMTDGWWHTLFSYNSRNNLRHDSVFFSFSICTILVIISIEYGNRHYFNCTRIAQGGEFVFTLRRILNAHEHCWSAKKIPREPNKSKLMICVCRKISQPQQNRQTYQICKETVVFSFDLIAMNCII